MKPNFALDLTFDRISLLHRAGEAGWHVVGEVTLDSPDLGGALAALRKKGSTLDPTGMRTALIIPAEQIRYLDIPAASAPHGDYDAAAADALEGATPYALDDLAFDWTVQGARLHIAAVARETLAEAESFASDHGFSPLCFVADPDPDIFAGAPFFGMTRAAEKAGLLLPGADPIKRLGAHPEPRQDAGPRGDGDASAALSFASVRAERGLPPTIAPRLAGVARITPAPLPDAEARAISGAAQASLAPRDGALTLGPAMRASPPPAVTAPTAPVAADDAPADRIGDTPRAAATAASDEAERLTVFGARGKARARRGKPRFLGLILTAALLLAMIGIAAWAAIFPESGLGHLLRGSRPQIAVTPDIPELAPPAPIAPAKDATATPILPTDNSAIARTPHRPIGAPEMTGLPAPDQPAVAPRGTGPVDAPGLEGVADRPTDPPRAPETRGRYAATGIWPSAPRPPDEPETENLDSLYRTSIDPGLTFQDAIALPQARTLAAEPAPARPSLPPPPGRRFALDGRGFVRATPEGALTPEGVRVHAGPPPLRPPDTPPRAVPLPGLVPTEEAVRARETMSDIRPRSRPESLIEDHERGALGGLTRSELATLRPRPRPVTPAAPAGAPPAAVEAAIAAAMSVAPAETAPAPTKEAVAVSLKPHLRPKTVTREAVSRPAAAAAPAIPTSASIAQRATERNAVNLRQVNLIGVYGGPSDRRALVRLSNGRYRKVQVGDAIDGGRVSAIGDTELHYTKRGRNVVLRMPRG